MRLHFVAEAGKVLFSLAFVAAFATLVAAQSVTSTPAATPAPIAVAPGDAAVSGFSGVGLADATLPPGVNPLDKTVITLASPSLKILDLSSIGGEAATQLLPPNVKFAVPAKDIGQVFGLAFDAGSGAGAPNIYAAATSLYGLTIVAEKPGPDGTPVRLKAGAPGARFMEGQFGPGATPGAIWKIDGTTGKPSLFAETVDGSAGNSGPAVGDIAIDAKSNSLFASDLDTGLIHRFPLDGGGANRSTFDHGTTGRAAAQLPAVADDKKRADIASASFNPGDPKTWGFTQPERRIDGLAVRDGRLYYAVASGPEIWSVGIAADGSFAGDARREVEIRAEKPSVISDIVFDADGRMTAALRGALKGAPDYRQFVEPEAGAVLRYSPKTGDAKSPWVTPPETYTVGATSNTASGGVALGYAYNADGTYDFGKCSATLGATGDALPVVGGTSVNGAQVMRGDLVQPAKAPEKSVFVDFDALQNDKALTGHVGDIEIFQPCDGSQFPAMAGDPGAAPDSGAGAAPGGFGGPGGGGGGGGLPGEALPAEGTPEEGLAEAPVDPNASNLAETEAQQCPPPGSGKVPTIDDAAADGLSVKNVGERACTPNPDGKTTKCRFTVAFENKTDTAQEQFIKFRTEPAPQGPMGSETPGNSSGVRGDGAFFGFGSGPSDKVEPGQTGPPVVFVGDYLNGQEPVGQPSVDRVPRIRRNETAKCQPPQNGEQVCSVPLTFENPSQLDNPKIEITSNAEPKGVTISKGDQILSPTGSRNQGATITTFDTPFPANSTEELVATVVLPEGADTTFVARISDESTAAAEKLAQERADAAAAASQQAGGATTPGQTSDPGANQSCIAQGTPKNEPTLGAPIGQEAGNEPGATPSGETGPSSAEPSNTGPTACSPGQGINVFSFMPFSAECFTNADGNKECKWTTVLQNAPNQPELQAKFSELPLKVTSETENDFRVTEDPNGGERSFILTGPAAGGKQQITSLIAVFPPSNRPEPTAEISISPSTLAAAACPGDASPPPAGGQPAPCAEAPKPIQIFSFMPSEGCGLNQNGNKLCRWTASAQHVPFFAGDLEARFSVDPIEVNTEFPTDYHIKKGASGTPTDFSLEPHGVPDEQQTIFIVGEFPGNKPDPTIEISPAQSTIDAHNAQIAKACPMASKQEPDAAPPGQAVPAPDTPPASEQPDLVVTKLTPGKKDENGLVTCDVTTTCRFQIAVINNGGTYAGPLTIEDKIEPPPMPPGAAVQPKPQSISIVTENGTDPRLKCDPPTDFNVSCKAESIELKKGEVVNVTVEVVPGLVWKNLDTNLMANCAFLTFNNMPPDGSPPKHHSCKVVKLDPFDVKVAKTGGQSCQPGKECKFELDIFNPGNIPHDDPVTVTDKLTGIGNAQIVSLTPVSATTNGVAKTPDAFPCSPPPTQAPFTCTGHMRLEVGEHNRYDVVIRIPEGAPSSGAFTNCAGVGKDAASSAPGSTDDVCHTTKLEPAAPDPQCPQGWTGTYPNCTAPQISGGPNSTDPGQTPPQLTGGPNSTVDDACFGGMILVSAGECRCPAPTILNGSTGTCVAAPDCPDGYTGEYPYCQLAPTLTGGSNATTDAEDRKNRRTSTTTSTRRVGGGPTSRQTGGTNSTESSQDRKDRRTSAGGGRRGGGGSRTPPAVNPPGLTGGRNDAVQGPTVGKFPPSGPPRRIGKAKPLPTTQPSVTKFPSSGPPRRIGKAKPQPTTQPSATKFPSSGAPRRIGKAKPQPDKRINFGASKNDNKNNYVPPK